MRARIVIATVVLCLVSGSAGAQGYQAGQNAGLTEGYLYGGPPPELGRDPSPMSDEGGEAWSTELRRQQEWRRGYRDGYEMGTFERDEEDCRGRRC